MNEIQTVLWATSIILKSVGPYGLSFLLGPLFLGILPYLPTEDHDPESPVFDQEKLEKEYDFIVVGGGSGGSVVASRLSEIPHWQVLLLEAGEDENVVTDIPTFASYLQLSTLDWQYTTEPSGTSCLGMIEGRCRWPRGKVLGGCSTTNYMIYSRGNRYDYDTWEKLGNPGWSYNDVLKYFIKMEDNRNPFLAQSPLHGTGGPVTVQESPWKTPMAAAFVKGGVEIGYSNRDLNGEQQAGFMMAQGTIRRGRRCSANKAYLKPVKLRSNLHIALNCHVTKILIDKETKRAYGVQFERKRKEQEILARKEVILSAGTVNSPQILMLSGIGPQKELMNHGIETIVDLPGVGRNLQDHVGAGGLTFTVAKPVSLVLDRFSPIQTIKEYILKEKGPLTTLGGSEGIAFVATKYGNISWPDIQFHMVASSLNSQLSRSIINLREDIYNAVYQLLENKDVYNIIPILVRPQSRGWIKLNSKNPKDKPIIFPNYFHEPIDIRRLIEGIKIAIKVSETAAFRAMGSKLVDTPLPPCKNHRFGTDQYWECHIRTISMTIFHPVGTCMMGPTNDPLSVVDSKLRVYGVAGLRVVDGSIIPRQTTGNTNVPILMIGEKASDLIKEAWFEGGNIEKSFEYSIV